MFESFSWITLALLLNKIPSSLVWQIRSASKSKRGLLFIS